jgi:hypothetical protein
VPWFSRFVSRSLTTEASPCGIRGEPSGTGALRFSLVIIVPLILCTTDVIQGDPGGKVNVLEGDTIGHCEEKTCKHVSNSEWLTTERAAGISSPNYDRFLFVGWKNSEFYKRKLDTPNELLVRILDAVASVKDVKINSNNTRSSSTSCRVHWGRRWDFSNIYCKL